VLGARRDANVVPGKNSPVYLSIDIDTIDPAFAPATGTPETGGWSTREIRTIIRGLEGINLAAADIVEVAPAYDTNAELTTVCHTTPSHPRFR